MAWYDSAVFYHIYPLGLCGCPHDNKGESGRHFDQLTEWADHAKRIGCSAIYIGPLFESGSHGYDTADYRLVDRRLGSNEDFKQFVSHCHDMGVKIIVDGVFNHTGRGFFAFEDLKRNRENSSYKDWYCNVNFWGNNEYNDGFSYDNWGGHNMLVKLNLWNQAVKDYLFDTVRFWIQEFDIDGIRLDAADVLDFGFMGDLRRVCDGLKNEFWLMGEVIHGDYSRWANEGMLHSVTNYELHKGIYSGHNDHNYFEIAHSIRRLNGIVGDRIRLYTFTDNHDVSRIYSKLNNKAHMVPAAMIAYMVPGIPSVYYGSEFGIEGVKQHGSDWNLRPCLDLADFDENGELPRLFKALGRIKRDFPEASYGEYQELLLTNRQFAFGRVMNGKCIVTAVNNDDNPAHLEIGLPVRAGRAVNLLTLSDEPRIPDAAAQEEMRRQLVAQKDELQERSGQLVGAAGEIQSKAYDVQKAVAELDVPTLAVGLKDGIKEAISGPAGQLLSAIRNMERVYNEFAGRCGAEGTGPSTHALDGCENLELRDGKLIVDLAPNNGVVAFVEE